MDQVEEVKYILRRLNVGNFNTLPQNLVKMKGGTVHKLKLDEQQITTIPIGIFDRLTSLLELNISRNYIDELPSGIFDKLKNLENLYLNQNQLSTLKPALFRNLSNLTELHLQHNQIDNLPDNIFNGLENLKSLNISNNKLSSIPKSLKYLDTLEWIDLTKNKQLPIKNQRQIILRSRVQNYLKSM